MNITGNLDGEFGAGTKPLLVNRSNVVSKLVDTDLRNFGKMHLVLINSNELAVQKECTLYS